jgi:hypothetical protein
MSDLVLEHDWMKEGDFTQIELITLCAHAAGIISWSRLTSHYGRVRIGCAVFTIEQEGSG